jgi:hypothetical protein
MRKPTVHKGKNFLSILLSLGLGFNLLVLFALGVKVDSPQSPLKQSMRADSELRTTLKILELNDLGLNTAIGEKLSLLDPSPLYIPIANRGININPEYDLVDLQGTVEVNFPDQLIFPRKHPDRFLVENSLPVPLAKTLSDLHRKFWFLGMPRINHALQTTTLDSRPLEMMVKILGQNQTLQIVNLSASEVFKGAEITPLKLIIIIDEVRPVGLPMLTAGSNSGDIDDEIRLLVAKALIHQCVLNSGVYEISIGH